MTETKKQRDDARCLDRIKKEIRDSRNPQFNFFNRKVPHRIRKQLATDALRQLFYARNPDSVNPEVME